MLTTNPFHSENDDHFREECAVFGIYGSSDAAKHGALCLHAMQHRGQEGTGLVTYDDSNDQFHAHRDHGHVGEVFGDPNVMAQLTGNSAIGHNRYSTTGDTVKRNVQPLFADFEFGGLAIAHNGNLTNAVILRDELVRNGAIFQSTTDTEVIVHLMANNSGSVVNRLVATLGRIEGAYSLVCLTRKKLIGVRDPMGVRPLVLGRLGDAYIFASETVALDIVGAEKVRDVEPGEVIVIDENGLRSQFPFPKLKSRFCVFEYIYFSRPDSVLEGRSVYEARRRIGSELAREAPIEADVVVPVPDSGVPSAVGYAAEAGINFEVGIVRSHYMGRTFIEPSDEIRHLGVKLKHNANRHALEGKRVILVDDSIVRGTTSKKIVEMVRSAGATEVHLRITSPPTTHSCFYGVDTPERDQLMAAKYSIEEMRRHIGCDSLVFISMDGLYRAMGFDGRDDESPYYCDACFSGDYPIRVADRESPPVARQLSLLKDAS